MSWAVWMTVAMFALREPPPRDEQPMMAATAIVAIATTTLPIIPQDVRRYSGCHLDFVRRLMIQYAA